MANPWEDISLADYESHMSLDSVRQLQALDGIMKEQFVAYPARTVMVLGIAGGNGLGHIRAGDFDKIYGVDINGDYLDAVSARYPQLSGVLECVRADLMTETDRLSHSELLIADLLIEYIGFDAFTKAVKQVSPEYVSCVIQINTDTKNWVSDSPYLHAFDRLDEVHHEIDAASLISAMEKAGYSLVLRSDTPLPNGKALARTDFVRKDIRQ
jgi:hypothetical protein